MLMGKQYKELTDSDRAFIEKQKLFYIASASYAEVNLAPKGYDSMRVLNSSQLLVLDMRGSSNRVARDIENGGEITIMFNAYEGKAHILRTFCHGKVISPSDDAFEEYLNAFNVDGSYIRQIFLFDIYAVESSCGMSIPFMEFKSEREELRDWAIKKVKEDKLGDYMKKNHTPVDLKGI